MADKKKHYITTPFMKAVGVYVTKPDQYEGKEFYHLRMEPTPEQLAAFTAEVRTLFPDEKFGPNAKLGTSVSNAGLVTINPTSKHKTIVYDCGNPPKPIDASKMGAGSIVRVKCEAYVKKGNVNLMMGNVQVKELKEWGGSGGPGFDPVEDGYTASDPFDDQPDTPTVPAAVQPGASALDI